jgi:hypothetical protein
MSRLMKAIGAFLLVCIMLACMSVTGEARRRHHRWRNPEAGKRKAGKRIGVGAAIGAGAGGLIGGRKGALIGAGAGAGGGAAYHYHKKSQARNRHRRRRL